MAQKKSDPHALQVAKAVQEAVWPATVILFGSRGRGDHRESSDIDLLIIAASENTRGPEITARCTALEYMKENPPVLGADIICMTKAQFGRKRLANQHIAGQASNQGATMSGERLEYGNEHQDNYPDHWPETKQRLENTEEFQFHFNNLLDGNMGNQKMMGFMGQQALENALKSWLSAHNDIRDWGHELRPLWEDVHKKPEDWSTGRMQDLRQTIEGLFDYTRYEAQTRPGRPWTGSATTRWRTGTADHPTRWTARNWAGC